MSLAVILIVPWLGAFLPKATVSLEYGGSFMADRQGNLLLCHPNPDTFG